AIRVESFGGPEVLRLAEVPDPKAGPGQLRVRVEAVGVNFIDVYHRTGLYPNPLPLVPGQEGAGVVDEIGPGVDGFREGDRVGWA
ncbi:alcohol dehydrogenase catalytic domain-containing protein, partial [Klebsiella pneumoniae]|nr:alcohol dehydrogenase catalytic domain-containing protein [Klebsiella pneumoniae]